MTDFLDYDMDDPDADNHSTGSSIGELVLSVQDAFEQLIGCSETTPDGSYIIKKDVVANALHAFTELAEAVKNTAIDRIPPSPTSPSSSNSQKILERLELIEK